MVMAIIIHNRRSEEASKEAKIRNIPGLHLDLAQRQRDITRPRRSVIAQHPDSSPAANIATEFGKEEYALKDGSSISSTLERRGQGPIRNRCKSRCSSEVSCFLESRDQCHTSRSFEHRSTSSYQVHGVMSEVHGQATAFSNISR